jgi:hypothetical protein
MNQKFSWIVLLTFFACSGSESVPVNDSANVLADAGVSMDTTVPVNDVQAPDLGPAPGEDLVASVNDASDGTGTDMVTQNSDYLGTWAQFQHAATITDSPIGQFNTTIHTLHLVEVTQEGDGSLVAHHIVCDIQAESTSAISADTIVPDSYIQSLVPYSRSVVFDAVGGTFTGARVTEVKGCVLSDNENEDLPTSADDSRVTDQDNDGNPGMTIQVSGAINGDLYVVERNWTELNGTMTGMRIDGLLTWGVEQNKLGQSNMILSMDIPSWVDPDASKSYFEMVQITAGDSCIELLTKKDSLF